MPEIGEQADILRALGRFLDDQEATDIKIQARELVLQVSWSQGRPGDETRAYQDHDLADLREQAKQLRYGGGGSPAGSLAELLRTLGQELDENNFEANGIIQEDEGFYVSGVMDGRYANQTFSTAALLERSEERRSARGTAPAAPSAPAGDPMAGVKVGAAVMTHDDQRVGKVGDLRGQFFKVEGGFLQRPYWLPAECISSADAERVTLGATKSQLDSYKLHNPPDVP